MSNTILLKRSGTPAAVPVAGNLSLGEISLNYADGVLYFLNSSNAVTVLANANTASGTQLVNGTSNVRVASGSNVTISSAGTANVLTVSSTGTVISGTQSVTGNITGGNVLTGGLVSATSNVTGGNILTGGLISATSTITSTSNITGGNIRTVGQVSATGNVTTDTYFIGNGAYLSGISAAISVTKIENGNSNVWVNTPGGDVTVSAGGVANVALFSTGSLTLQGAFGTPKTIVANVVISGNINAMLLGPLTFGNGYGLTVPTSSTVYVYAP
jgi:hypothetical protein